MSKAEMMVQQITQHTYGTWRKQAHWKKPLLITDAEGVFMFDAEGNRYLDLSSQLMCSNLGHKNQAVIEAIVKQAEKLPYVAPGFTTEALASAINALRSVLPEPLERFFFSTSGTAANEAALKIVRQRQAPNYKILSRYRSYHGATPGGLTFTGDPRRIIAERARCTVEGVRFAPGRIVPPPEYFPLLRGICDEHGVLLIADEVMSGWFRTGKPFAIEHWGVTPDILTTAKGCTAAYTPVGLTATTGEIADFFEEEPFDHGHTYAYHALSLSAIPAAVREYKRLMDSGLPQRVAAHLREKLYTMGERHPSVGDVRGIGHFWALELVKNRRTKEPFNVKADKFTGPRP